MAKTIWLCNTEMCRQEDEATAERANVMFTAVVSVRGTTRAEIWLVSCCRKMDDRELSETVQPHSFLISRLAHAPYLTLQLTLNTTLARNAEAVSRCR